jgi:ABC-type amino acid transport substrate-binding protein
VAEAEGLLSCSALVLWVGRDDSAQSRMSLPASLHLHHLHTRHKMWRAALVFALLLLRADSAPTLTLLVLPDTPTSGAAAAAARGLALDALAPSVSLNVTALAPLPAAPAAAVGAVLGALAASPRGGALAVLAPGGGGGGAAAAAVSDALRVLGVPLLLYTPSDAQDGAAALRIAPTLQALAGAVVGLARYYSWSSVALLATDDAPGLAGALMLRSAAAAAGVGVTSTFTFTAGSADSARATAAALASQAGSLVLLAWLSDAAALQFFGSAAAAGALAPRFTWVSTSGALPAPATALAGMLVVRAAPAPSATVALARLAGALGAATAADTNANAAFIADAVYTAAAAAAAAAAGAPPVWPAAAAAAACLSSNFSGSISAAECLAAAAFTPSAAPPPPALGLSTLLASPSALSLLSALPLTTGAAAAPWGPAGPAASARQRGTFFSAAYVTSLGALAPFATCDSAASNWTLATPPVWASGTLTPPSDGLSLRGAALTVLVPLQAPFAAQDPTSGKISGFAISVLDAVALSAGFTYTLRVANSSQSYNELVAAVAAGEADMLVGDVTITSARSTRVAFSQPYYQNSNVLVVRRPQPAAPDIYFFLRPFSLYVWLAWLASMALSSALTTFYETQHSLAVEAKQQRALELQGQGQGQHKSFLREYARSTPHGSFVGSALLLGAIVATPDSAAAKFTSLLSFLSGIIMVSTYTGSVAATLATGLAPTYVSSVSELPALPPATVGIMSDDANTLLYRSLVSTSYKPLGVNYADQLPALLRGDVDVTLGDAATLQYAVDTQYCDLVVTASGLWPSGFGFAMPRSWAASRVAVVDAGILGLQASGSLVTLQEQAWGAPKCPPFNPSATRSQGQVTISQLGGLFLLLAAAQATVFALSALQRCVRAGLRARSRPVTSAKNPAHAGAAAMQAGREGGEGEGGAAAQWVEMREANEVWYKNAVTGELAWTLPQGARALSE